MLFKRHGCCKCATSCLRMFAWYVARSHAWSPHLQRVRKFISRSLGMLGALNVCFLWQAGFRAHFFASLLWKTRKFCLRHALSNYRRVFQAAVRFNNKKTKTTGRIFPGTVRFSYSRSISSPRVALHIGRQFVMGKLTFPQFPYLLKLLGGVARFSLTRYYDSIQPAEQWMGIGTVLSIIKKIQ